MNNLNFWSKFFMLDFWSSHVRGFRWSYYVIWQITSILFFSTATTNSECNSSTISHYTSEKIFSALRNSHLSPCHSITRWTTFCSFLTSTTYLYRDIFYYFVPFLHCKINKVEHLLFPAHFYTLLSMYMINQEKKFSM